MNACKTGLTDKQVFYDKFLRGKFYWFVCIRNFDIFSMTRFYVVSKLYFVSMFSMTNVLVAELRVQTSKQNLPDKNLS